ncbi:MAG: hypothetical protein ACLPWF_05085 [Bryobacteraceae bacterium]
MTIQEVESRLEQGLAKLRSPEYKPLEALLQPLIPKGYRVRVSLVDKNGRKKRKTASADNWSPDLGEVRVNFEPDTNPDILVAEQESELSAESPARTSDSVASEPISDLVRTLDRVEFRPGYQFVALKWFRDVALPGESFDWALSDSARQNILREAIERRLILISKVPNPKSPQFPVTAIRLNRLLPEIQAILGEQVADSDFKPVDIRGEKLSATVLRERR